MSNKTASRNRVEYERRRIAKAAEFLGIDLTAEQELIAALLHIALLDEKRPPTV
jgi:hypothetical protein